MNPSKPSCLLSTAEKAKFAKALSSGFHTLVFIRINQKLHSSKSLVAQMVKNPPVNWENWVQSFEQKGLVSYSPWGCKDFVTKPSTLFKNS